MNQTNLKYRLMMMLLVVVLLISESAGVLTPVRAVLDRWSQPLWLLGAGAINVGTYPVRVYFSAQKNYQKIQDLERRLNEALAQNSDLDNLKTENEYLRSLVNSQDVRNKKILIATPIVSYGRPQVLLDNAAQTQVQVNNPVLVNNTLVGLVADRVGNLAAINLLVANDDPKILAKTDSGATGIVIGDGRHIWLTEITKNSPLAVGEKIVTLGQQDIPKGILIGRINQVVNDDASPIVKAIVEQDSSFYEASVVEIRKE